MNWESFIENLRAGQIIPVIGNDLILLKDENGSQVPLYDYIAHQWTKKLNIADRGQRIGELALAYPNANIMSTTKSMLKTLDSDRLDLTLLEKLAAVTDFTFFVSTNPDNFLVNALQKTRQLSEAQIRVHNYSPQPLSFPKSHPKEDPPVTVFKIFGSFDGAISPALNDEEMLEYVFSLSNKYQQPQNQLAGYFMRQVKNKILLLIGCGFPDWFMRFIIRIISYERYRGRVLSDYIVWNGIHQSPTLNAFLETFDKNIYPPADQNGNISSFIDQMFECWSAGSPDAALDYSETVFINYSEKNQQQALKLKQWLQAEGINVWAEKSHGGKGRDQKTMMHAVKKCKVFIPLLSEESLSDWYKNKQIPEWPLIKSRWDFEESTGSFSFEIIPVTLNNTDSGDSRIPDFMRHLAIWFDFNLEKDRDRIIAAVKKHLKMEMG